MVKVLLQAREKNKCLDEGFDTDSINGSDSTIIVSVGTMDNSESVTPLEQFKACWIVFFLQLFRALNDRHYPVRSHDPEIDGESVNESFHSPVYFALLAFAFYSIRFQKAVVEKKRSKSKEKSLKWFYQRKVYQRLNLLHEDKCTGFILIYFGDFTK